MRLEPAVLLDITESMTENVAPGAYMKKNVLAKQIVNGLTGQLEALDSQAIDEGDDEGGVFMTTFSNGIATNVGDINTRNFDRVWSAIHWHGGTYITPGFRKAKAHFDEEFAEVLNDSDVEESLKPKLLLYVITDGALSDLDDASSWLARAANQVYVYAVVIGSGRDHDAAVRSWKAIEQQNNHVMVDEATGSVDAEAIVSRMLSRIG